MSKAAGGNNQISWTEKLSFFVGLIALILTGWTYWKTTKDQEKFQAYSYWQNFLALAVEHPQLANGIDSIDGMSIETLGCLPKENIHLHDSAHAEYVQYAWFVSNALGAAEIVFNLQKGDSIWEAALIEVLVNHKSFYNSCAFDERSYAKDFRDLLRRTRNTTIQKRGEIKQ
jgi:hypothetical protein